MKEPKDEEEAEEVEIFSFFFSDDESPPNSEGGIEKNSADAVVANGKLAVFEAVLVESEVEVDANGFERVTVVLAGTEEDVAEDKEVDDEESGLITFAGEKLNVAEAESSTIVDFSTFNEAAGEKV